MKDTKILDSGNTQIEPTDRHTVVKLQNPKEKIRKATRGMGQVIYKGKTILYQTA